MTCSAVKTLYGRCSGSKLGACACDTCTRRKFYRSRQSWRVCIVALAPHSRKRVYTVDLPEVLLTLFIVFCVAAALFAGMWFLLPVAVLAWVLVPAADKVATDIVNTSAPGSGCALVSGLLTILLAAVVVLGALLVLAAANGAI